MATIAPPKTPERDAFTLIASAVLDAGCGPADVPSLVAEFRCAAELEEEICAALAVLSPLEARLSSAGCAAVLAASGGAS